MSTLSPAQMQELLNTPEARAVRKKLAKSLGENPDSEPSGYTQDDTDDDEA